MFAVGPSGHAARAAVTDNEVGIFDPIFRPENFHEIELDFHGIPMTCQSQKSVDPDHVGIHGQAGDPESVPKQYVGGLASDTRQGHEIFHPRRDFPAVSPQKRAGGALNILRLVFIKSGRADQIFKFFGIRSGIIIRGLILFKQGGRHHVYAFIGTLRRKDRGHKQLERVRKIEGAFHPRINFAEFSHYLQYAFLFPGDGFPHFRFSFQLPTSHLRLF
jgi:hypothetical protein